MVHKHEPFGTVHTFCEKNPAPPSAGQSSHTTEPAWPHPPTHRLSFFNRGSFGKEFSRQADACNRRSTLGLHPGPEHRGLRKGPVHYEFQVRSCSFRLECSLSNRAYPGQLGG